LPEEFRLRTRILVAEDNVFNQKVVVRQLQDMNFDVSVAANGVEVLAAIDRTPFDLILMDCQMPEMDGYDPPQRFAAARARQDTHRSSP